MNPYLVLDITHFVVVVVVDVDILHLILLEAFNNNCPHCG